MCFHCVKNFNSCPTIIFGKNIHASLSPLQDLTCKQKTAIFWQAKCLKILFIILVGSDRFRRGKYDTSLSEILVRILYFPFLFCSLPTHRTKIWEGLNTHTNSKVSRKKYWVYFIIRCTIFLIPQVLMNIVINVYM